MSEPLGDGWFQAIGQADVGVGVRMAAVVPDSPLVVVQGDVSDALLVTVACGDWLATHVVVADAYELTPADDPVTSVPAAAASLARWSQAVGRGPVTEAKARRLLERLAGVKGSEAAPALLKGLGFSLRQPGEWWQVLGGCTADPGLFAPHIWGLEHLDVATLRWVASRGEDFFGIWDADDPAQPCEQWPTTHDGAAAMHARFYELALLPVLQATQLNGARAWARHLNDSAVVAHRDSEGNGALMVLVVDHPTRPVATSQLQPSGRPIRVDSSRAARAGISVGGLDTDLDLPSHVLFPTSSFTELLRGFTASLAGRVISEWHAVPGDVPRGLLPTIDWVRQQLNDPSMSPNE